MENQFETVTLETPVDNILLLTLDRPHRANAMNTQMGLDLRSIFTQLYVDPEPYRCMIATGRGDKVFSAGGDLKDRDGMTDQQWRKQHAIFEQMVRAMRDCPIPIIGAINGAAYGGGCEFALGCDFLYASTTARFALTEITLGIMPGAGGTMNLPLTVGERRAKELIYTGTPFSAEEACNWGMVNKVVEPEGLLDETLETAIKIAGNAPISVKQAKKSMGVSTQVDRNIGYMFELEAYERMITSEDRLEGVRAFNEKRKAVFKGK